MTLLDRLSRIFRDRGGNFGLTTALLAPLLLVAAGGSVDISHLFAEKANLQQLLDAGVLSAAGKSDSASRRAEVQSFLSTLSATSGGPTASEISAGLNVVDNADGSLTATYKQNFQTYFLGIAGLSQMNIAVSSTALAAAATATANPAPCIYVLANTNQALLVNSGAKVTSQDCKVDVASISNPAFIMNSNATISTAKFCVKGTQYINNGGKITNMQTGCATDPDPYAGVLPEPTVSSTCTTSGALNGNSFTVQPGVQCGTTFNGSPTITFAPGLHIIKGTMIINANSTVIAQGVTFYFPDSNSKIQFNGGVTLTASAPTSGTYNGLLMYEKTSDASNNANKQQFVFNGSKGESLQGIIYLPNRNVTYNSTTNSTSRIALFVNTMIMNSSNWQIEPYTGGSAGSQTSANAQARLIQ